VSSDDQPQQPRIGFITDGSVSRAAPHWEQVDRVGGAPGPGASLRARASGERARARTAALRPVALRVGVPTALTPAVIVALRPVGTLGVVAAAAAVGVVLAVGAAVFGYLTRARWGWDGPSRELRRRARHETRVAATLDPLESAGWVVLHDRLVDAHRVPHLLIGPPGVVLLYPSSFGPLARTRYWVRRALALTHSAVEWVLTLPATVLLRHQLPHLSATVDPVIDDTNVSWAAAAWARHTLVGRLATDPTLDGWTVLVSPTSPCCTDPPTGGRLPSTTAASATTTPALSYAATSTTNCPEPSPAGPPPTGGTLEIQSVHSCATERQYVAYFQHGCHSCSGSARATRDPGRGSCRSRVGARRPVASACRWIAAGVGAATRRC